MSPRSWSPPLVPAERFGFLAGIGLAAATYLVAQSSAVRSLGIAPSAGAVVLGIAMGNVVRIPGSWRRGVGFAAQTLLRAGVVLLGLRIVASDLVAIGPRGVVLIVVVVAVAFTATVRLGDALQLSRPLGLVVATGYAICGVSAIAAVRSSAEANDEEVAYAVALVTIFGTTAIVALPLLNEMLLLSEHEFGMWAGGSVHDVAQVVATAAAGGGLESAVPVKLARVALLVPLVALLSWHRQRGATTRGLGAGATPHQRRSLPALPTFTVLFVVAVGVRSVGVLPTALVESGVSASTALLGTAMGAVGLGVDLTRIKRIGLRPLVLGTVVWLLVTGSALLVVGVG
ncbi:MAG: YeiH family protein [Acidimicrobiia bacterium]